MFKEEKKCQDKNGEVQVMLERRPERRYHKKQVLDLEKEGLWRELLDSGNIEICVSDW